MPIHKNIYIYTSGVVYHIYICIYIYIHTYTYKTDLSYPPANVRSPGGQGWQMDERAHGTEERPAGHTAQLLASPREEFCGSVIVDNVDICM